MSGDRCDRIDCLDKIFRRKCRICRSRPLLSVDGKISDAGGFVAIKVNVGDPYERASEALAPNIPIESSDGVKDSVQPE